MKWVSEIPPHWVWSGDIWERIPDGKKFSANLIEEFWECEADPETIPFPKNCKVEEA